MAKEPNIFIPVLISAAVLAAGWAGLMLWVAFQNNNQGEFFDPQSGAVEWGYVALLFLAWFVPVFFPITLIGAALQWLYHKARKVKS